MKLGDPMMIHRISSIPNDLVDVENLLVDVIDLGISEMMDSRILGILEKSGDS